MFLVCLALPFETTTTPSKIMLNVTPTAALGLFFSVRRCRDAFRQRETSFAHLYVPKFWGLECF